MSEKKTKKKTAGTAWRNRIVDHRDVAPGQLIANPLNYRVHSELQSRALRGMLNGLGVVRSVTVNKRTGRIVDGHLRVTLAVKEKQPTVPVEYVDLTEAEEREVLATLDPLTHMATNDQTSVDALLEKIKGTAAADVLAILGTAEPDAGEKETRTIKATKGTLIKIGTYRFPVSKKHFTAWLEAIRQKCGFDDESVITEIRKRLKLNAP